MRRFVPLLALVFLAFGSAGARPGIAQKADLGNVAFPNSGSAEAQEPFLRGLALLHSFEFADARAAFGEAREIDPDFALAFWGEAMAWNYPLWYRQFRDEALEALTGFAPTPAERLARTPTERERLWMAAVEVLYGEGPKHTRDDRYERAMAEIHRRYPDDPEAAAFHALAILGTAHEGRDHGKYMRAGAIASEIRVSHPNHPGAAHYVIHSFDDPEHAMLGLSAARAYSEIAPDAAHAQHMTTHVFLALGMWDEVVRANERADAVSDARAARDGRPANSCGHYNEWLLYGYLMQEREDAAFTLLRACGEQAAENAGRVRSFLDMRSRYLLDTRKWEGGALELPVDVADAPGAALTDAYIRGFAAARIGDAEGTRRWLQRYREVRPAVEAYMAAEGRTEESYVRRPHVLELHLQGLLEEVRENRLGAIAHFAEAARIEESLPHAYGPPAIEQPSYELLGEALLDEDSPTAAAEAFSVAEARAPGRVPALRGLVKAAEAAGDEELAAWGRSRLRGEGAGTSGDR